MKNINDHEIGKAALDKAFELLNTDREAVQAAHWAILPMAVRRVAVMCANMPKDRADDSLKKFTVTERAQIRRSVARLYTQLEIVARAMVGGELADITKPDYHHETNGIASLH